MIPTTRSRYLATSRSNAATSPPCTRLTTARSASASSLRSGVATRVFSRALLAFIRQRQASPASVSWQIETEAPVPFSPRGAQRPHLGEQDVAQGKEVGGRRLAR